MPGDTLKQKATRGFLWNVLDKISVQVGQFVIGVILARILMPEDFGLIGMLSIFSAVSQSLIDSGMGSGLVQKTNRSNIDYSTVFVFNIVASILIYTILFFLAPFIASFFSTPQLVLLSRVLTLNIIINSLSIVQRTRLTIRINFKIIAKVNVVAFLAGGIFGVYFALTGFGVWALVIQNLVRATTMMIMYWSFSKWQPSIEFSARSFKELFSFGSKILIAGLYGRIINNIYQIVIGKVYSVSVLGFYTRSKGFAELTAGTVASIVHQVSYPILASLREDKKRMVSVYSRLIRISSFGIFPVMTMLAMVADPFVRLLLGDRWIPVIELLQWMCFARIFFPISVINMNILNAMGRSDLYLRVELSKFPIIALTLYLTIPLGVKAMIIGHVVTSVMAFFINAYLPGRFYGYGPLNQLKDMVPVIIATIGMALSIYIVINIYESPMLKLLFGCMIGAISYIGFSYILRINELKEVINVISARRSES